MTNAIEMTRRQMYDHLEGAKCAVERGILPKSSLPGFEVALEDHLEQLRQDHEALHQTARERFESIRSLEQANAALIERLGAMTGERDEIQLRLHAIDHKFFAQDQALKLAGEELRDRKIEIGSLIRTRDLAERMAGYRLKQLDGTLQELAALRKSATGTSASDSKEKPASETSEAKSAMVLLGALVEVQTFAANWAFGDVKPKKALRQITEALHTDAVVKAQKVFEGKGELECYLPLASEVCDLCKNIEPEQCFLCSA